VEKLLYVRCKRREKDAQGLTETPR
jgi:hypothetical protein